MMLTAMEIDMINALSIEALEVMLRDTKSVVIINDGKVVGLEHEEI